MPGEGGERNDISAGFCMESLCERSVYCSGNRTTFSRGYCSGSAVRTVLCWLLCTYNIWATGLGLLGVRVRARARVRVRVRVRVRIRVTVRVRAEGLDRLGCCVYSLKKEDCRRWHRWRSC